MFDLSFRQEDYMVEFVLKHESRLYRTAVAIIGNKADAEDVIQDVFVKVIKGCFFLEI